MVYNSEKRQDHQDAIALNNKYKECNQNTKMELSEYDPVLRCWKFKIVKRDPRAIEIKPMLKPETHNRKNREAKANLVKVENKSPAQPKKEVQITKAQRQMIYRLYQDGTDKNVIAKKFEIPFRRVSREIITMNKSLGIKQTLRKNKNRHAVEELVNQNITSCMEIVRLTGISRTTVRTHLAKIKEESTAKSSKRQL